MKKLIIHGLDTKFFFKKFLFELTEVVNSRNSIKYKTLKNS